MGGRTHVLVPKGILRVIPSPRPLSLVTAAVVAIAGLALPGAATAAATGAAATVAAANRSTNAGGQQEPGRYLVRYRPGADVAAEARTLRSEGVAVRRTFSHAVRAAVVTTTAAEAATLRRSPDVVAVEPDARVHTTEVRAPWGLDRIDQRVLPLSTTFRTVNQGAGVDAYVVDTGVRADHVDFGSRVASGWSAIPDGRGTADCDGHGTHVAGTIGGRTYGVAKAVRIIPVRVLDCDGAGNMSDVVAGLEWVAEHHTAGAPAVVNLSLGGAVTSTVDVALERVIADGVVAVVAAGNSAVDACTASPARVPSAITVAATDATDRQASFSNDGPCVDLFAPGVAIASTWHTSTTATNLLQGTSMASPHAAGAAALLLAQSPASTSAQIASRLFAEATANKVTAAGAGTPNRLLFTSPGETGTAPTPVPSAPEAPRDLHATAGIRAARVTWTPGGDGGSPLTRQTVSVYSGGSRVGSFPVSGTTTAARVTGLRAGLSYRFAVRARNPVGKSPLSARSNAVRPRR